MEFDNSITTRQVEDRGTDGVPFSEILIHGASTGVLITGAVLELSARWREFHLVMMTDDVPGEDILGIHLLNKDLRVLDSAFIGNPYSTGFFRFLEWRGNDRMSFRFSGEKIWILRLLDKPSFRIPFSIGTPGVRRRFGFTRHFVVSVV